MKYRIEVYEERATGPDHSAEMKLIEHVESEAAVVVAGFLEAVAERIRPKERPRP